MQIDNHKHTPPHTSFHSFFSPLTHTISLIPSLLSHLLRNSYSFTISIFSFSHPLHSPLAYHSLILSILSIPSILSTHSFSILSSFPSSSHIPSIFSTHPHTIPPSHTPNAPLCVSMSTVMVWCVRRTAYALSTRRRVVFPTPPPPHTHTCGRGDMRLDVGT